MWVLDHLQLADDTSLLDDWDEKLCSLVREFGRVCERRKLKVNVGKGHYRDSVRVGIGSLPADGGKMVERLYEGFLAWGRGLVRVSEAKEMWLETGVWGHLFTLWLPIDWNLLVVVEGMDVIWHESHRYILHSWFTSISDPMWQLDHIIEGVMCNLQEENIFSDPL